MKVSPSLREADRNEFVFREIDSHRETKLLVVRGRLSSPCTNTTLARVARLYSSTEVPRPRSLFFNQPITESHLRPKATFVRPKMPEGGKVDERKGLGKVEQ